MLETVATSETNRQNAANSGPFPNQHWNNDRNMGHPQKYIDLIRKLILDAQKLISTSLDGDVSDEKMLRRWSNDLILLNTISGEMLAPWKRRLAHSGAVLQIEYVQGPLAALETIQFAIEEGLLSSYRNLVVAETFSDLFEQGRHLLDQGYFLAAGVVFRAVLEEKLRNLCVAADCLPAKVRPTIEDLSQALYKSQLKAYDKTMMLNITALAAVGNDAAHNNASLCIENVERLMHGTLDFMSRDLTA